MEQLLNKLYYDPETGYSSADKLYRKAKQQDTKITMKIVKEFIDAQATAQITKQVKKNKNYNTIISPSIKNNYQMDIMYLPNPTLNKGYKYLLTCIDVYSRFAFVEPLKSKSGEAVFEGIKKLFHNNGNPKNLNVDIGNEFIYSPFKKYCEDNNIEVWFSNPEQDNKNAIIERFHRTLRNIILKYSVANSRPFISVLQSLIKNYNTTHHKTIKNTPLDIWSGKESNNQPINIVSHNFKLGDVVRHLVKKKVFDKNSSTTTYTKTTYTITKIEGHSIFLDDLTKPFKEHELIKAVGANMETSYDKSIQEEGRQKTIKRRLNREGLN
jgi:hypothetical protein